MLSNAQQVWEWREGTGAFPGRHVDSMGVVGYDVEATDGHIGTIEGPSARFGANCLVVDAGSWISGRRILLPAGTVREIDREERTVFLDRSMEDVEHSPDYDPETFITPQYRDRVAHYFAAAYRGTPGP